MEGAGTKADEIAFAIEEAIVSGQLEPGSVLRQEQLSERFAVSRTPIREALRRLAALGLVSFEPNKGVRVRLLSREELHEAFLVRAELESLATELAVPNMTEEDLAELDAAEARFSALTLELRRKTREGEHDATLISDWARANHAFHDVIYAAANVPYIERLAKSARRTFLGQTVWAAGLDIDELYARNDMQHRAIREAIAAGSAAGARTLAREHVLASGHMQQVILDHMGAQLHERESGRRRSA